MCTTSTKVQQLEAELHDLTSQESKDEASLAKLKKQLHDLEAKVKDQEEELDEQAGTIQMLEQVRPVNEVVFMSCLLFLMFRFECCRISLSFIKAKLRLEMEMERQRQTHSREIESKDEEVDEIRQSCNKKVSSVIS